MYEKYTGHFKYIYARFYRAVYSRAIMLVREIIKCPLLKENVRVLLCGTASSETTRNYVNFIQGKNNKTSINIFDLNFQPLIASSEKLKMDEYIDSSKVRYIQGNALKMPFIDGSIDLLETDYFLQFFSSKDKPVIFAANS